MNRKEFMHAGLALSGLAVLPAALGNTQKDIFEAEQIHEFVSAAHGDLAKTKKILQENPLIINCANQFNKGDFETALGGASHMGRNDIADFLIEKGARLDMFSMTFLGYTDFVRALIGKLPHYLTAPGPHGFTLLHHANVGKNEKFADWLKKKGLNETRFENVF